MLDKDAFFDEFHIEEEFYKSELKWEDLSAIYEDYEKRLNAEDDIKALAKDVVALLDKDKPDAVRAIYGRVKEPKHLIEKIIRKVGIEDVRKYKSINVQNYTEIVKDLIGIRVLVLAKEEWKEADSQIRKVFQEEFDEPPKAYICYGDRLVFDEKLIEVEYTNKGYRSQHYIVKHGEYFAEIQVRTLAEEVYGEFDHRARYPYKQKNKFLIRYSKIVSKSVTELDDLISTCFNINEEILKQLDEEFKQDNYVDWSKQTTNRNVQLRTSHNYEKVNSAKELANQKVLRRGE